MVPGATASSTASLAMTDSYLRVRFRAPMRICTDPRSVTPTIRVLFEEVRIALIDSVPDLDVAGKDLLFQLVDLGKGCSWNFVFRVFHWGETHAILRETQYDRLAAGKLLLSVVFNHRLYRDIG